MGTRAGGLHLRRPVPPPGGAGALHVRGERAGPPQHYPGHGSDLASGLDGMRAYLDRCHAESLAIFGTLTDAALRAPCVLRLTCPPPEGTPAPSSQSRSLPPGAQMATWKWLRAMAEHEAHHRGQLYLMASLRGRTVAPLFGLTEQQLAAASQAKS